MDDLRRDVIVETCKAWFECHPAEARAFAKQLKYDWERQNSGGRWSDCKGGGFKKYTLPYDLVMTGAAISRRLQDKGYEIEPLLFQDEDDVRAIAQEFPDFLCRMNMDRDKRARRSPGKLIVP